MFNQFSVIATLLSASLISSPVWAADQALRLNVSMNFGEPPKVALQWQQFANSPQAQPLPPLQLDLTALSAAANKAPAKAPAKAPEESGINWWVVGAVGTAVVVGVVALARKDEVNGSCMGGFGQPVTCTNN
jgi:hypothetical protein